MPAQPRRSVVARVVVAAATLLLVQSPVVRAEGDVTPPVGSISINGGAAFVASAWVSIAITASDDASGIAQVELANDGSLWTDVGLGSPVDWQLPVGPGPPAPPGNADGPRSLPGWRREQLRSFWQVGWDPGPGDGWLLAAYYDPPAKRAAGGGGAPTDAPGIASSEPSPVATPSSPGPSSPGPSDRATATPGDVAAVDPSAAPEPSPAGGSISAVAEREPTLLGWAMIALVLMAATAGVILLHPVARRRALGLRDRLRPRGSRPPH